MKADQIVEILETAAGQLGVKVQYESLAASGPTGGGGLCKVKGQWRVIIDKKTAPSERVSILADALATMDTESLFLPPKVRDLLARRRAAVSRPS
ncbi:MAG: hypothetical protein JXP73_05610 [Deltaproteobacteria bacterium]|jgi:hypothetical protein|nr:hypothetical protein [Deltaproteobacteria bacterium]